MAEEPGNKSASLHEEIRELERALMERRKALSEEEPGREEKEIFREVFKERYPAPSEEKITLSPVPSASASVPLKKSAGDGTAKVREEELQALISIAFERGVTEAVRIAKKSTPWLLDALHDRLIDEYYLKLQQARQVE